MVVTRRLSRKVNRVRLIGSHCISGDERSRSVAMQIEAAELVRHCAALALCCLPLLGAVYLRHARPSAVTRALPACCRCLLAAFCCRHLLHLLPPLALRKPGPRSLWFGGHPGEGSEQSVPWPVWSLSGARSRLVSTWQKSHRFSH